MTITWISNIKDVRCKLAGMWPWIGQVMLVTLAYMAGWTVVRGELVSKKEEEWLVPNTVVGVIVNRTHNFQINDLTLPKSLKELQESEEKVFIPLPKPS